MSSTAGAASDAGWGRFPLSAVYQAARLYYLEEATQADIAERLGVSRPTVSRLIAEARRAGLVHIEVADPFLTQSESLAEDLRSSLSLDAAYVAPITHAGTLGSDFAVGVAAAVDAMQLAPGDAMLMSSGRTVYDIANAGMPRLAGVQLVPAVGGRADPMPWFQTNEITRAAAQHSGGIPAFLFAEALPSVAMRASLDADPTFRHVLELWATAKGAIVGIGAPPPSRDASARGGIDENALASAAGDVCLNFFRHDGSAIEFAGSDRLVRASRETLSAIPHTVGVAVGAAKVGSILGAVRGGYVNELVTDAATARALLDANR